MTQRASKEGFGRESGRSERFLLRVFVITLIPVMIAGAIFLFLSLYLFLKGAPFLRLREIGIEGNRKVPTREILAMAELEDEPNILSLNIKAVNRRMGQHPWIETAMTKRVFPDGIRIVIQERNPVAVVHLDDLYYYVDEKGVVFDKVKNRKKPGYPVLTGLEREDLEREKEKVRALLHEAIYFLQVAQHSRILPYRSILRIQLDRATGLLVHTTQQGTQIRMGFGDFEGKLQRLAKIWSILRGMELSSIDCSIPGKVIVQQKRGRTG